MVFVSVLNMAIFSLSPLETCRLDVERAIGEFRMNRPVIFVDGEDYAIAWTTDHFCEDTARKLENLGKKPARLVLTKARLNALGVTRDDDGSFALPLLDEERIAKLGLQVKARADAPVHALNALDKAALELARLSLLTPAVIIVPVAKNVATQFPFLQVKASDIPAYRDLQIKDLRIVARAPVPLENARDSEFVIFRGGEGLRDQVAVIVGKPDVTKAVLLRMHSACLTGDLFGSLKCDCGDQLRGSIRIMAENGGGILLYLDQEGRGHGLTNKMRAYKLQAEGLDTYEADEALGFGLDQRRFDFAAEMLKLLGVKHVRLLTNNPEKAKALCKSGLVVEDQRLIGRVTDDNVRYLSAKRDKGGHKIDLEQPMNLRD
jgi:GTP cyclohydrolase II